MGERGEKEEERMEKGTSRQRQVRENGVKEKRDKGRRKEKIKKV